MAYELNFHNEDQLLLVSISGEREKAELISSAQDAWREIAAIGHARRLDKILVLSSATGNYPALDAFVINSRLAECGVERVWKIAFVNLDQASYPDVKFAETVAVNRGFNIGVFRHEADARRWLQETP